MLAVLRNHVLDQPFTLPCVCKEPGTTSVYGSTELTLPDDSTHPLITGVVVVVVVVDIFFCPIRARFQSCEINSGILLDINVHS